MDIYKSKQQLDELTDQEVKDYRLSLITGIAFDELPLTYLNELAVYLKVRFKQEEIDRLNKWIEESKQDDNSLETRAKRNIADVIKNIGGVEKFYLWGLDREKEELNNAYQLY